MKKKNIICLILAVGMMCNLMYGITVFAGYTANDAGFFSKLDLTGELSNIAPYVNYGDYETAKTLLLSHYRQKTSPIIDEMSGGTNTINNNLCKLGVMWQGVSYIGNMTFTNKYSNVTLDVSSVIKSASKYTIELTGYDTTSSEIEVYTKENNNGIVLTLTADGEERTFYSAQDTYIDFTNQSTNYGSATSMYIAERTSSNGILGSGTKRAYIQFDLSSLSGKTITGASLKLRGRTPLNGSGADAMAWLLNDNTWKESSLSWNSTKQTIISFNGAGTIPWTKLNDSEAQSESIDTEFVRYMHRMYWMTSMANYYRVKSDEGTAQTAIDMLMDYIDAEYTSGIGGGGGLPTAIRARELTKCHYWLSKSEYMTPDKEVKYLSYMHELGEYLEKKENFRANHNWGTFQVLGLNRLSSYFNEFDKAQDWQTLAVTRVGLLLDNIVTSDGSYYEGSSSYVYEAIRQLMTTINDFETGGISLNSAVKEKLRTIVEYALNISYPNGYDTVYGDGYYAKINLDAAVSYLNDPCLTYIYTQGWSGKKPTYTSKVYPGGTTAAEGNNKMAIMRSGFTEDDLAMYINNGSANWLSHTHPDDLAAVAYAYGSPLLIDPGSYSYDEVAPSEWQRHTTEAHNTITIDGDVQRTKGYYGTIDDISFTPQFDYYKAHSTAYENFNHSRKVYFVKDKFWIVADDVDITASGSHTFVQNWHFPSYAAPVLNGKSVSTKSSDKANITVAQLETDGITVSLKDGYYCDTGKVLNTGKFSSFTKTVNKTNTPATFRTLLYPRPAGDNSAVTVTSLASTYDAAAAYDISDGSVTDTVIINKGKDWRYIGVNSKNIAFSGEFMYFGRDEQGGLRKISALNTKMIKSGGNTLLESEENIKNVSFTIENGVLTVDSDDENLFTDANIYWYSDLNYIAFNGIAYGFSKTENKITLADPIASVSNILDEADASNIEYIDKKAVTTEIRASDRGGIWTLCNSGSNSDEYVGDLYTAEDENGIILYRNSENITRQFSVKYNTNTTDADAAVKFAYRSENTLKAIHLIQISSETEGSKLKTTNQSV